MAEDLILGSASPRRHELLDSLGVRFSVVAAGVDEERLAAGLEAHDAVVALALAKAEAIRSRLGDVHVPILTADTLVIGPDGLVGKPTSPEHIEELLAGYSNSSVEVVTGVAVSTPGQSDTSTRAVSTWVHFGEISAADRARYAASGVGDDKAGGLELQGAAKPFIDRVEGCWTNVVGLPLCSVAELLDRPELVACAAVRSDLRAAGCDRKADLGSTAVAIGDPDRSTVIDRNLTND